MSRYAAFLRAVNLGARRKLPMATVREVLPARLGYAQVRTYIASGNVLFTADDEGTEADAARHAAEIGQVLGEVAGFDVPTVVLTPSSYDVVLAEQPFAPGDPKQVHVSLVQGLLADRVGGPAKAHALTDVVAGDEQVHVGSRALYLHLPHNVHQSRLASAAGRALPEATARNLATLQKVRTLLDG